MTDAHRSFDPKSIQPMWLSVSRKFVLLLIVGVAVGVIAAWLGSTVYANGWRRLQLAYLVAFSFVLSLSLGSLFIVLIQHLARAGWSVIIRRPAEIFSLNIVTVAILALPIAWCVQRGEVYPWAQIGHGSTSHANKEAENTEPSVAQSGLVEISATNVDDIPIITRSVSEGRWFIPRLRVGLGFPPGQVHGAVQMEDDGNQIAVRQAVHHIGDSDAHSASKETTKDQILADLYVHQTPDDLTRAKQPWLNRQSFLTRMPLYFGVWVVIAGFYFQQSRRQDLVADRFAATRRMEWLAGVAAIAFGFSLTFAAFDWLMSLDPHWYSTMFGVYFFAGCAVGGFAVNLLAIHLANRRRVMSGLISDEHRRDLGRFLFAFVFFWGYIAFSQYMLLWYANVPETTRWFAVRGASMATGYSNSWGWLLLALLFGHFFIPFLGIMSRHVKSSSRAMIFWTSWLLVMHYFDLYWLVMPELGPQFTFGLIELGTLMGVVCFWLLGASLIATRTSLVAVGDPRLSESLRAVEMY